MVGGSLMTDEQIIKAYDTVLACGHHYATEAEMYAEEECWRCAE